MALLSSRYASCSLDQYGWSVADCEISVIIEGLNHLPFGLALSRLSSRHCSGGISVAECEIRAMVERLNCLPERPGLASCSFDCMVCVADSEIRSMVEC